MLYMQQTLYCPVCKERLGTRTKSTPFEELCKECGFYFYFPPNATTPTKCISKKSKENICRCLTCEGKRRTHDNFSD